MCNVLKTLSCISSWLKLLKHWWYGTLWQDSQVGILGNSTGNDFGTMKVKCGEPYLVDKKLKGSHFFDDYTPWHENPGTGSNTVTMSIQKGVTQTETWQHGVKIKLCDEVEYTGQVSKGVANSKVEVLSIAMSVPSQKRGRLRYKRGWVDTEFTIDHREKQVSMVATGPPPQEHPIIKDTVRVEVFLGDSVAEYEDLWDPKSWPPCSAESVLPSTDFPRANQQTAYSSETDQRIGKRKCKRNSCIARHM